MKTELKYELQCVSCGNILKVIVSEHDIEYKTKCGCGNNIIFKTKGINLIKYEKVDDI